MKKETSGNDAVKVSDPGDLRIQLRNFLRMGHPTDLHRFDLAVEPYRLADLHRGLELAFPQNEGFVVEMKGLGGLLVDLGDGKLEPVANPDLDTLLIQSSRGGFGWTGSLALSLGPGRQGSFPRHSVTLVAQDSMRALFHVHVDEHGWVTLQGATRHDPASEEWGQGLRRRLEAWMGQHSCYRRHMLRPVPQMGGARLSLEFMTLPDADDLRMPPELVIELEESFLHFQTHRETLQELGLEARRGLLLHGDPGTGKTVTCRYLKSRLPEHTFFVVDSNVFSLLDAVFAVARKIQPAVVIIEDVDMIAQERSSGAHNWLVGDLLNLLDGIQDRDDVGIILTSNSCAFLEKALIDRPGRIDHIVRYKPPTDSHRVELLRSFTREMTLDIDEPDLIGLTAGLTPAQLRELVKRATVLSLQRSGTETWSRVLSGEDLRRSASSLSTGQDVRRGRRIGLAEKRPGLFFQEK